MKPIVLRITAIMILGIVLIIQITLSKGDITEYDEMTIKKMAWDILNEKEQDTVVSTTEDLFITNSLDEDTSQIVLNESLLNIPDVWKYAVIEETNYKEIRLDKHNKDFPFKRRFYEWINSKDLVLRVTFETIDPIIGAITVYVDPKKGEVVGFGLRF